MHSILRTALGLSVLLLTLVAAAPTAHAEDEAKKAAEPTTAAELLALGDKTFRMRDYEDATAIYKRAIAAAENEINGKSGDLPQAETALLAEALAMTARGYLIRGKGKEGLPYLERAAKVANVAQPNGWSRYLGVKGRFEWKVEKDKPKATKTFEHMHAYCMKHELWSRAVDAAHMVAITGTHDQQVAWGLKGIEAAEKGGMEGWLGPLWNNLGNTYDELGQQEKALEAFKKARHYHWKGEGEHRKLVADWAVGMAYRKCGKLKEAKQWLRPVLAWAMRRWLEEKTPERGEWVGLASMDLGLVALAEGRKDAARLDLDRAHHLLAAVKMEEWHPAAWKELTEARAAVALPKGAPESKGVRETKAQLANFGGAIDMFRMRHKKLPGTLEALTVTDSRNPHPFMKSIPKDPWGNAYEYRILSRSKYQLRSYGPDGEPETDDDVVYPDKR